MNILTFLFIASALIVYEAQPSRLFKRDSGHSFTCQSCPHIDVWALKCGKSYDSPHAKGCAIFYDCQQEDGSNNKSPTYPSGGQTTPSGSYPPSNQANPPGSNPPGSQTSPTGSYPNSGETTTTTSYPQNDPETEPAPEPTTTTTVTAPPSDTGATYP